MMKPGYQYNKNYFTVTINASFLHTSSPLQNSSELISNLLLPNFSEGLKENLSDAEIRVIRRDFNVFDDILFKTKAKPLNIKNLNNKILDISNLNTSEKIIIKKFTEVFNKKIESNNIKYLLNNNSEFYLTSFWGKNYIIILDKIDNFNTHKTCYNTDGKFISKAKDTLSYGGRIRREGEFFTVISKGIEIIYVQKIIKFDQTKLLLNDPLEVAFKESENNISSCSTGQSLTTAPIPTTVITPTTIPTLTTATIPTPATATINTPSQSLTQIKDPSKHADILEDHTSLSTDVNEHNTLRINSNLENQDNIQRIKFLNSFEKYDNDCIKVKSSIIDTISRIKENLKSLGESPISKAITTHIDKVMLRTPYFKSLINKSYKVVYREIVAFIKILLFAGVVFVILQILYHRKLIWNYIIIIPEILNKIWESTIKVVNRDITRILEIISERRVLVNQNLNIFHQEANEIGNSITWIITKTGNIIMDSSSMFMTKTVNIISETRESLNNYVISKLDDWGLIFKESALLQQQPDHSGQLWLILGKKPLVLSEDFYQTPTLVSNFINTKTQTKSLLWVEQILAGQPLIQDGIQISFLEWCLCIGAVIVVVVLWKRFWDNTVATAEEVSEIIMENARKEAEKAAEIAKLHSMLQSRIEDCAEKTEMLINSTDMLTRTKDLAVDKLMEMTQGVRRYKGELTNSQIEWELDLEHLDRVRALLRRERFRNESLLNQLQLERLKANELESISNSSNQWKLESMQNASKILDLKDKLEQMSSNNAGLNSNIEALNLKLDEILLENSDLKGILELRDGELAKAKEMIKGWRETTLDIIDLVDEAAKESGHSVDLESLRESFKTPINTLMRSLNEPTETLTGSTGSLDAPTELSMKALNTIPTLDRSAQKISLTCPKDAELIKANELLNALKVKSRECLTEVSKTLFEADHGLESKNEKDLESFRQFLSSSENSLNKPLDLFSLNLEIESFNCPKIGEYEKLNHAAKELINRFAINSLTPVEPMKTVELEETGWIYWTDAVCVRNIKAAATAVQNLAEILEPTL